MPVDPQKMSFRVTDTDALLDTLRSIDIGRPSGSVEIRKEWAEPYAVAHLLSALAQAGSVLMFPLELIRQDRPDFLLTMGGKEIGIEHTDARSPNETAKNVLRNSMREQGEIESDLYIITPVEPGEPKRTAKKLKEEIRADDSMSPGDSAGLLWGDPNGVAQNWADAMLYVIGSKECVLNTPGFTRYDEDWLLVRDAWPFPRVRWKDACRHLFSRIQNRGHELQFHRVFIVTCENEGPVCEVTQSEYHLYPRNDLWVE